MTGSAPQPRHRRAEHGALLVALTAIFFTGWLLAGVANPEFDRVSPIARDVTVWGNAACLILLALLATWQPHKLSAKAYAPIAGACLVTGGVLSGVGLFLSNAWILVAGCAVLTVGRGLTTVLTCLGCIELGLGEIARLLAGSYTLAFVLRLATRPLPPWGGMLLFFLAPLVALCIASRTGKHALGQALHAEAPAERAVTKPATFLPFGHQLFLSLLLFRAVYGFAVIVNDSGTSTSHAAWVALAFAAVFLWLLARKTSPSPDTLFNLSALFVLAGFLAMSLGGSAETPVAGAFLLAGSGCYEIMAYYVLVALAWRNPDNAVATFAWGFAMYAVGVAAGAGLGRCAQALLALDPTATLRASAIAQFIFAAVICVSMRTFSFGDTVRTVQTDDRVETVPLTRQLDERCKALVSEHGLTPRESDVLCLLAQGRNSPFIQNELGLARNTVKVHVRHIYSKLDVHSQQELIDLVLK